MRPMIDDQSRLLRQAPTPISLLIDKALERYAVCRSFRLDGLARDFHAFELRVGRENGPCPGHGASLPTYQASQV